MKLKKEYSFTDKNTIWRILLSAEDDLVIETRNEISREAQFYALNFESGKKLMKNFQPGEKYWSGIEEVKNGVIIFHGFAKPDMPNHSGIIAVDIKAGKELWRNNEYSFLFSLKDKVYAYRQLFDRREYHILDFFTGEEEQTVELSNLEINSLREESEIFEGVDRYLFRFPIHLPNDKPDKKVPEKLINIFEGKEPVYCEFLEFDKFYIFSYNFISVDLKYQKIIVLNRESGKIMFDKVINKNFDKIIPDSFFVYKSTLLIIENKTLLTTYRLT